MNPFKYGQVVIKNDFCPRTEIERQIKDYIISGQNLLIQGERRIGKTSLVFEILRKLRDHKTIYIDLMEIKSVIDLCKRIISGITSAEKVSGFLEKTLMSLSQLRPSMSLDPLTGAPTFSIDSSINAKPEHIEGLLDIILKESKKKKIVVFFDEFQDILNLEESKECLAILRSKIQFHSKFPYIFAGSIRNKLNEIFTHPESPFFKSAIIINLGPIDHKAFSKFILNKFKTGNKTITNNLLDKLYDFAGEIPGDIQQMCGAIWEISSKNKKVDENIIPDALKLIFSRELKGYEACINLLTDQQLKCLSGLARLGGKSPLSSEFLSFTGIRQPASVKRALVKFMNTRIIYKHNGEYKFVNPFFRDWIIYKNF